MSKLFEELDFRETPIGDLILQRRRFLQLDGVEVYEVKLGDAFLMSSLFHEVEVALSKLGLAALATPDADVVVGGLPEPPPADRGRSASARAGPAIS